MSLKTEKGEAGRAWNGEEWNAEACNGQVGTGELRFGADRHGLVTSGQGVHTSVLSGGNIRRMSYG